ncbi:unnamed protein product [marine sediment metagenome]|uniref:Uncharacterized protein n=1 Tax=marine sediment metagenome TaxID=412755 RepID=X1RNQ5_9ZZZZ
MSVLDRRAERKKRQPGYPTTVPDRREVDDKRREHQLDRLYGNRYDAQKDTGDCKTLFGMVYESFVGMIPSVTPVSAIEQTNTHGEKSKEK